MSLSELFIRRPVMTTLLMVAILIFGIIAWRQLPVSDLPKIDYPTISVSANLPGADPETMAASVATPLERQFSTIAGIDSMTSTSNQGSSQITIQFALNRDIDAAAQDVQAAIAAAQRRLPTEMPSPPTWRKVNPAESPILLLTVRSETLPLSKVNEYADTVLAQRISMLEGVAQVQVYGAQKYAVRIQIDPDRLASQNIGVDEFALAIAQGNANRPTGTVWGSQKVWSLQSDGGVKDAAGFRSLHVAWRNGAPVRVENLAKVLDGVENDKTAAWYVDTRAIVLAVQRQPGSNTVAIVDTIRALLPKLQEAIPTQVQLGVLIDRSQPIRTSVADVEHTLLLTAVLVILVIFVFLRRLSSTIIPALSLPLSLIGTFAAMWYFSFYLDNLSLMALTLATGFVVDDAIVVLENIVRRMEGGESAWQAACAGSRQIGFTVISMTISLMAVFIPILFMSGLLGLFFREFAATVMLAIGVSGFVSLTLVPMLCSRFLKPTSERHGALYRGCERFFEGMLRLYERTLDLALRHPRWILLSLLLSMVFSAWLLVVVPKGMIPNEDMGMLRITTEYASDISFPELVRHQCKVAELVKQHPDVDAFMSSVGNEGSNSGRFFVRLKESPERKRTPEQIVAELRKTLNTIPGVRVSLQNPPPINIGGRMARAQFQYTLQGYQTEELYRVADTMLGSMRSMAELTDVSTDMILDSPQIILRLNRDRAASLGISPDQIETTLGLAYGVRQVSTIYSDSNMYQVVLEIDPRKQADPEVLARLPIRPNAGPSRELVPLGTLATFTTGVGPVSINHQGLIPAVTIFFNLKEGVSLGTAVDHINDTARRLVPGSITGAFSGAAQAFQESLSSMGWLLLLAIAVIYLVLGILYESFLHPLTILSGLPSAGLGALLALLIFGNELNVYSFIGIIMLVGIIKKNAIMMIDFAIQARLQEHLSAFDAIRRGCLVRFRPIMMTTMAALMGTLPLAIGLGTVSNSRRSLGIAVVGGLIFSQLITLYITPVIYLYLDNLQEWFRRKLTHKRKVTDILEEKNM